MRIYILAAGWAAAILLLAVFARSESIDRETANLLLLVMPMIAFTTLLPRGGCRRAVQES